MLRVGVVGAGRMGRIRALAASELGATVDFVFDPDEARTNELAGMVGARGVVDESDIRFDKINALFLCTPPSAREIGVRAIENGVSLIMEKPLGLSAESSRPFMKALKKVPVINAVGFMNRYRNSLMQVKEQLEMEKPLAIALRWIGGRYNVPWWKDPGQSGGPINEQCSHLVDLCRYLIGEIVSVQAFVDKKDRAAELLALNLRFAKGQLGTLLYSCKASEKSIGLQVISTTRDFKLEGWDFHFANDEIMDRDKNEIFKTETNAFLNAVATNDSTAIRSDIKDAFHTQMVMDAILQSASEQTPIEIV